MMLQQQGAEAEEGEGARKVAGSAAPQAAAAAAAAAERIVRPGRGWGR